MEVNFMKSYSKLEKHFYRIHQIDHASAILGWDEAVMMPQGSGDARAKALAELKVLSHESLVSPELQNLVYESELEINNLTDWQRANLREIKHTVLSARSIKKDLVEAISLANSRCEQRWRKLREENNWKDFLPLLQQVINLSRDEASQRSEVLHLSPYDSLIDQFSPGITSQEISLLFDEIKIFLPPLIDKITANQRNLPSILEPRHISIEDQKILGLEVMKSLGFDFNRGRLDVSHHPFCGGVPQDVRITTRYNSNQFLGSLNGVIHETGHALYEQNLPLEWASQPVGLARGMDIHESQSLFFENYIGSNFNFLCFLSKLIRKTLNLNHESYFEPKNIYQLRNQVKPSYIRVNADEVTYPIHIIIRYEIERDLIENKINAKDIPEIWDFQMQKNLGLSTKNNFKDGCMQDVHWPSGAFGYFPSYTLGSIIAAQLFSKIQKTIPNLNSNLESGNLFEIKDWLKNNIWTFGRFYNSSELIIKSTGEKINPVYFKNYIEDKYLSENHYIL